jgi:hypothetical protein
MYVKILAILAISAGFGCQRRDPITYERLLDGLTNIAAVAQIDAPPTAMISSYDRTGANEDYNHFQGKTKDGQVILADLKGPGVISRFWFTGVPHDARIRFRFDGEKEPRLDFSWNELMAGLPPFDIAPISANEQYCWYTFLPIPFRQRLLITTEDRGYVYGGATKFYYQINWHPLPRGQTVESFSLPLAQEHTQTLESLADTWERMDFGPLPEPANDFDIAAGQRMAIWNGQGPATLQALTILPDMSTIVSALERDRMLRDVLLQIYWDGCPEPSVNVPLGDFFGSVWQRWRAESMCFGSKGDTFFCRFPMMFKKSARIELVNQSSHPLRVRVGTAQGGGQQGGYFHAGWRNSPASASGTAHTVLKALGRGRYVGCILSVVSADRTFWVLESDESMVIDGKRTWQGTGLEDYFNAGWYYQNVFARPLHGLPIKAPFRTEQYRLHSTDAVIIDKSFEMSFERGPDDASQAAFESVAFYYMDQPQAADSSLDNRMAPVDTVQPYSLMTDLWNFERFGDAQGQLDYLDRYREQFNPPFTETLALRSLACRRDSGALPVADFIAALDAFDAGTNALLETQQAALRQLYTETNTVLIQFYANMQSELYLDGERILTAGDPQQPTFTTAKLEPGKHVLVAASAWQQYPSWTQLAVRDANGFLVGTSESWRTAINPAGGWMRLDYDDAGWSAFPSPNSRVKGPPEEPFVWVHPDPFVNTLSHAHGLRPLQDWPDRKGRVVFRKVFEIE